MRDNRWLTVSGRKIKLQTSINGETFVPLTETGKWEMSMDQNGK